MPAAAAPPKPSPDEVSFAAGVGVRAGDAPSARDALALEVLEVGVEAPVDAEDGLLAVPADGVLLDVVVEGPGVARGPVGPDPMALPAVEPEDMADGEAADDAGFALEPDVADAPLGADDPEPVEPGVDDAALLAAAGLAEPETGLPEDGVVVFEGVPEDAEGDDVVDAAAGDGVPGVDDFAASVFGLAETGAALAAAAVAPVAFAVSDGLGPSAGLDVADAAVAGFGVSALPASSLAASLLLAAGVAGLAELAGDASSAFDPDVLVPRLEVYFTSLLAVSADAAGLALAAGPALSSCAAPVGPVGASGRADAFGSLAFLSLSVTGLFFSALRSIVWPRVLVGRVRRGRLVIASAPFSPGSAGISAGCPHRTHSRYSSFIPMGRASTA
ncbi:hypothetical protein VQ042_12795 [Aurantimonas sp. A2-1-M11]|uniref:hypothetical protein n=1 Tax=Aurantimonas sp. A2-1-M11 TaxID=3113712 RepID=UPI002F95F436